jgi:hypothetical protein
VSRESWTILDKFVLLLAVSEPQNCSDDYRSDRESEKAKTQKYPCTAEAAWVAASGKAELYVRDRLGAALASRHPKLTVAREWNKHDLAVLDANFQPLTIVEGKHLYDFDLLVPNLRARYKRAIQKDCVKLKRQKSDQPLISLLITSLRGSVPGDRARVVKYAPASNRKLKELGREMMPVAVKEARILLGELGSVVHQQELAVGHCVGIDVHLWVWLAKPGKLRGRYYRKYGCSIVDLITLEFLQQVQLVATNPRSFVMSKIFHPVFFAEARPTLQCISEYFGAVLGVVLLLFQVLVL